VLGGLEEAHTQTLTHTHTHTYLYRSLVSSSITSLDLASNFPKALLDNQNVILWVRRDCEIPSIGEVISLVSPLCVSSRSHGLHGAWQKARSENGEKNGTAKPCAGRTVPQTSRLEEETPTATSFPQGAHAVLEQGRFIADESKNTCLFLFAHHRTCDKMIGITHLEWILMNICTSLQHRSNFLQVRATCSSIVNEQKDFPIY